jgi:hypothetical protein
MPDKELVVIDKQVIINYIKGIIQTAYLLGSNGNNPAKEQLIKSTENLPLVSKENTNVS